jgi:hypothetical protein
MGQDIAGACGQLVVETAKAGAPTTTDIEDAGVARSSSSSAPTPTVPAASVCSDGDPVAVTKGDDPWRRRASVSATLAALAALLLLLRLLVIFAMKSL